MNTTTARHLLAVWNPSYEADALDAHVTLLLKHTRDFRAGARDEDDVYVWWGKLRSPYKQEPLPHLGDILALDETLPGGESRGPTLKPPMKGRAGGLSGEWDFRT